MFDNLNWSRPARNSDYDFLGCRNPKHASTGNVVLLDFFCYDGSMIRKVIGCFQQNLPRLFRWTGIVAGSVPKENRLNLSDDGSIFFQMVSKAIFNALIRS
jgi:hypothetical protein